MFCKWCGGDLTSSDTRCKRCGKEVPALSDCGGFYDLVSDANKFATGSPRIEASTERPVDLSRKPDPAKKDSLTRMKKNPASRNDKSSRKLQHRLFGPMIVGFALIIFLLIAVLGKIDQNNNAVSGLRNDLQAMDERIDAIHGPTEPENKDPQSTESANDPVQEKQDVIFAVKIPSVPSAEKINADLSVGDYADVSLTIDNSTAPYGWCVSVTYEIDDDAYSSNETQELFRWQYRCGPESEWKDISKEAGIQKDNDGKTELTIRSVEQLTAESNGQLELCCEISRTNTDGRALKIVVEGIRFSNQGNNEGNKKVNNGEQAVG